MLAGAQTVFDNAPLSAFDISNDGLTITNNADMTWGRFKKDDDSIASVSSSYATQLDNNQLPIGSGDWWAGALSTSTSAMSLAILGTIFIMIGKSRVHII